MIGSVGIESDNLSQIGGKIITRMISNYKNGGITTNEANTSLKTISGGLSGLNEDRFIEINSFKEAFKNLVEESTASIDKMPEHSTDQKQG